MKSISKHQIKQIDLLLLLSLLYNCWNSITKPSAKLLSGTNFTNQKSLIAKKRNSKTLAILPLITQTTTISALAEEKAVFAIDSASDIVRNFHGAINSHDLGSVEDLIAENCVYDD
ncbi:hypothetical protein FRX31_008415 [Thalictrum thalictroides]|uniref:Uncharacterized protein n=1 Tax=Thalictrum thalictroides TaxID=46969 RepID=A0A7J6WYK5_THATH|nr:hypothetical protein FRX31_008415 [Thalictrum thalictroides]